MFEASPADIVAIKRAATVSREHALAECRRRWPTLADQWLDGVLNRILAMRQDSVPHRAKHEPRMDGQGPGSRSHKD